LLILSHYVGDVHLPLHVGAIYLNADHLGQTGFKEARNVPPAQGLVADWAAAWATETLLASHAAFP
jgi:hypothetical protein